MKLPQCQSNAVLRPLLCIEEFICYWLSTYVVFRVNLEPLCCGVASTELYQAYDPLESGQADNHRETPDVTANTLFLAVIFAST